MKKLILFITILLLALTGCSNKTEASTITEEKEMDKHVKVIIISGQSNCSGESQRNYFKEKSDEYYYYKNDIKNVFINYYVDLGHNVSNGFTQVTFGQGSSTQTYGLELGLSSELSKAYPNEEVFVIKYSCGATSLYDDYHAKDGKLYNELIDFIKKSIQELESYEYIPTIVGFCWMQGETDSTNDEASNYYLNELNFFTAIREDLKDYTKEDGLIIVDGGISDCALWVNYEIINNAKKKIASESDLNFYIDTIEEGLHYNQEPESNPDIAHFDSMSEIKLGKLFAQKIIDALK